MSNQTEDILISNFNYFYFGARVCISLISFLGNTLTLISIAKYHTLHTPTNVFIANLALNDILLHTLGTLLFSMVMLSPEFTGYLQTKISKEGTINSSEPFQTTIVMVVFSQSHLPLESDSSFQDFRTLCMVKETVITCISGLGQFAIFLLALDRFIYIQRPLHYYAIMTAKRATKICIGISVFIITIIVGSQPFAYTLEPGGVCNSTMYRPWFLFIIVLPILLILTTINVCLYLRIAFVALKQAKDLGRVVPMQMQGSVEVQNTTSAQIKVTKMLGITLGVYFACFTPTLIMNVLKSQSSTMYIMRYIGYAAWYR